MKPTTFPVLFLALIFSVTSIAMMPPMSQEELQKESNQIVLGEVMKVECNGKIQEHKCATDTPYKATLKVIKTLKGKRLETLQLYFSETVFKEDCVGSPDTIHYPGDVAKYYLRCHEGSCRLTNYDGVEYQKQTKSPLPKCPKG